MRNLSRAHKRNAFFGRKPKGNTRPIERRAVWQAAKAAGHRTRGP